MIKYRQKLASQQTCLQPTCSLRRGMYNVAPSYQYSKPPPNQPSQAAFSIKSVSAVQEISYKRGHILVSIKCKAGNS